MEFKKDELLIIEFSLKQLRMQTNKDIIKASENGYNAAQMEQAIKDIDQILEKINNEIYK